jgi:hypothetical protein
MDAAAGRASELYDAYTSAAARLADDEQFVSARERWASFVTASHGDVFADVDDDNPRRAAFRDALYYDFVVERAIDSVEGSLGVELENRAPNANTDALDVPFRTLHERVLAEATGPIEPDIDLDTADGAVETLRRLHGEVHAPAFRRALGAYYTPRGLAELALDQIDLGDHRTETVLDPGCGAGVFLAAAIDRKVSAFEEATSPAAVVDAVTDTVIGIDLDPLAVKSAKLTYLLALGPTLAASPVERVSVPVFLTDTTGVTREDTITFEGKPRPISADHLVGNPPWLTWGDLGERVRAAWTDRAAALDLVPGDGAESRLGHGNDDISVSFVWACLDRYLADGGDAAVVLKRGLRSGPAGEPFRRGTVGDRNVAVTRVDDFGSLQPFDADVDAAVYTLRADTETSYPIARTLWRGDESGGGEGGPDFSSLAAMRASLSRTERDLVPVDPDDPASSWVSADAERRALGECAHRIRHGLKDDAKAVFSVDDDLLSRIELDHVYPYLRSKHIVKYGLFGHDRHLVPMAQTGEDNEAVLRESTPATYEYLAENRERLLDRSSSWLEDGPFYNLFGLGEYTWAPYKLVWCRLGFKPHFAVVSTIEDPELGEKPVVPGDHCMFVATDSRMAAHYLCALLNSAPYQRCLRDLAGNGKATLSKSLVSRLSLPAYEGRPVQRRLAELSIEAHDIVPEYTDVSKRAYNRRTIPPLERVQAEIDEAVASVLDRTED